ncbi:hypothetical protein V500_04890, partial [Pseudogymnoascus sp. VKM F-4518 (FW-2643)]
MGFLKLSKAVAGVVIAQTFFSTTRAQDVRNANGNTTPVDLAPAFATVNGEQLFPSERLQLTDAVLANLTSHGIDTSLFGFGTPDDEAAALDKRSGGCKVFPGDKAWPSAPVWRVLDLLSGGRLIATVPSAAACYEGWGGEDEGECEYVSENWTNSFFHLCPAHAHAHGFDPDTDNEPAWKTQP